MKAELRRALVEAEQALAGDARGHLGLGHRQAVWAALGSRQARARLAVLAARHVLPHWERVRPGDRLPHRLLELAEAVLRGEVEGAALAAERNQAVTDLDDASTLSTDKMSVAAGYAAHHALTAAIRDEAFDPAHLDPGARDEVVEPGDHDSGFLASIAAAAGAPWHEGSSAERRRTFWRWWLSEAVVRASESSPPAT
ncbi:MAG: hypothetical protein AMXMBFR34_37280 [Myxococcaceae bacterium]